MVSGMGYVPKLGEMPTRNKGQETRLIRSIDNGAALMQTIAV